MNENEDYKEIKNNLSSLFDETLSESKRTDEIAQSYKKKF